MRIVIVPALVLSSAGAAAQAKPDSWMGTWTLTQPGEVHLQRQSGAKERHQPAVASRRRRHAPVPGAGVSRLAVRPIASCHATMDAPRSCLMFLNSR